MDIIIFFSWISDYRNSNKRFIRSCINGAIKKLEKDSLPFLAGVNISLIESLGTKPGHQLLSTTQEDEIRNSDVFIGDWTVIDPYSRFENFRAKHFGYKRKRNLNSNVLHEYDCFSASNGYDGAILVMDSLRGSAHEDNDIIPVDLRGRRFPIEFQGTVEKDSLVADIYRALRESIPAAIQQRKNRFSPLHTWYEQDNRKCLNTPYYINESLISLKNEIRESASDLRILGLSGIGKTRLVHEAFRGEDDSFYRNNYLYVQYSDDESASIRNAILSHVSNEKDNSLIVVDNCPPAFAQFIQKSKADYDAKNKVITIFNRQDQDYLDRVQDVDYQVIKLDDVSSVVDDILNGVYTQISDDKKKIIKDFSAGLPMMAVILAENVKRGRIDYATIPNNEFVEKLLDTGDEQEKEILMTCAMFSHIGYRDEVAREARFLICNKNITPVLSGDDCAKMTLFERVFSKYTARGVFEIQGRFFAIRPIPLALRLAEDWLTGCNADRMLDVLSDIQNEDRNNNSQLLTSAFANQLSHLAGNQKAQKVIAIITGGNSPFANSEVLNTELGSRLFRSFVEVDPVSVASLFWRVFGDMSTDDLINIKDGRRNLVWTTQKLCFDHRTFLIGAKLLIKLSLAENETWGNNATNEVLNLFHVYLPGTEADLDQRLEVINWVRTLENAEGLLFDILSSALTSQHYSYISGAEMQGTNKLEHYTPSSKEILEYWESICQTIKSMINEDASRIIGLSKIVTDKFSGLVRVGAQDIAFDLAEFIAEKRHWDWDNLRDSIRLMFWRESSKDMPETLALRLNNLLQRLTKSDFISRLKDVEHIECRDWKEEQVKRNESYKAMAIEFVDKEHSSVKLMNDILNDSSLNPYATFGIEIYKHINSDKAIYNRLVDTIIANISIRKDYTNSTMLGFFGQTSKEDFTYVYDKLIREVPEALFILSAVRGERISECQILFELVKNGNAKIEAFDNFCSRYDWSNCSQEETISFFNQLVELSEAGAKIAISNLHSMLYFDAKDKRFRFLLDTYRNLITSKALPVDFNDEKYLENIELAINEYYSPDVASFISEHMINYYMSDNTSIHNNGYYLDSVLCVLFDKYFELVWPYWRKALVEPENMCFAYLLKYKLGCSIGGLTGGALFGKDHSDALRQWCVDYPEAAPVLLAMYIPVYVEEKLSPLAKFLLDEYGDNKRVLSELSCNLGSFSCIGSAVPIYERKIKAFKEIIPHKNPNVNQWLLDNIIFAENDIARENDRDAEDSILYR